MTGTRKKANPALGAGAPDPRALEAIGRALEAYYSDLVQAPLPDKLVELLTRLEAGERPSEREESGDANG